MVACGGVLMGLGICEKPGEEDDGYGDFGGGRVG